MSKSNLSRSETSLPQEAADPSSGHNENHAHGEAGRASQSDPSENHIGLNSSRLNPAGRSDHLTQRQDSLTDQMATVCELAVMHGCYDAHMWISRRFYGELT